MNWLKNWIFGNEAPAKQAKPPAPKEDLQARYVRNTLAFAKQQHKDLRHKQNEHETLAAALWITSRWRAKKTHWHWVWKLPCRIILKAKVIK